MVVPDLGEYRAERRDTTRGGYAIRLSCTARPPLSNMATAFLMRQPLSDYGRFAEDELALPRDDRRRGYRRLRRRGTHPLRATSLFFNTRSPTRCRQVRADGPRAQLASLLASTWRVDESRMKYLLELHKPQAHSEQSRARNHASCCRMTHGHLWRRRSRRHRRACGSAGSISPARLPSPRREMPSPPAGSRGRARRW